VASRTAVAIRKQLALDEISALAEEIGNQDAVKQLQSAKLRRQKDPDLTNVKVLEISAQIMREFVDRQTPDETPIHESIEGLQPKTLDALYAHNILTRDDLRKASSALLLSLPGVGPTSLQRMKAQL
jgi:predicted DNA-binding helix-hairpin-helix protein